MTDLNQLCLAPNLMTTMATNQWFISKLATQLSTPLLCPLLPTQLPSSRDLPHQCPSNLIFASVLAEPPLPCGLIHSVGEVIGIEVVIR